MPYRTRALEALEEWRQAERKLADTPSDAPEYWNRMADVQRTHAQYAEAERVAGMKSSKPETSGVPRELSHRAV